MAGRLIYFKCPVCGWTRPAIRTGRKALEQGKITPDQIKGKFHFGQGDLTSTPFIDIRYAVSEKGKGFVRKAEECLSFAQACREPAFADVAQEVVDVCLSILRIARKSRWIKVDLEELVSDV